jgi:hypothetical protein
MWQIWGRRKMHIGFWKGNIRERNHLEDFGINRKTILKWI